MVSASPPARTTTCTRLVVCEEVGGLAGGVATAADDHFIAATQLRLDEGGAVVDTGAVEL